MPWRAGKAKTRTIIKIQMPQGHAFTASALLAGITESSEEPLWQVVRAMEEGTTLMNSIAEHFEESGRKESGEIFRQKAKDNAKRARVIHDSVFKEEQLSEDTYPYKDILKNTINSARSS